MRLLVLLAAVWVACAAKGLREEFTWTRLNYRWPDRSSSDGLIFPGEAAGGGRPSTTDPSYVYENNIPMGANMWRDKLFITVPRRRLGVPSTLNFVWMNGTERHNVPLIPYPDWETNALPRAGETPASTRIVSVYRVAIDPCDRLWLVDTGVIEDPGGRMQLKPTTLVTIDLKTDQITHTYELSPGLLRPTSTLASVTVDAAADRCGDAFAYLPDLSGYGLVVFSLRQNRAWRVTHNYFFLEPEAGEFKIAGHRFQWNDGVFSCQLGAVHRDGTRDLYFHSMAGTHQYKVSTRVLTNESLATRSYHDDDFHVVGDKGRSMQTSAADLHQRLGVLFLGLVNRNALGCWNVRSRLKDVAIIKKDDDRMVYPSDVKVCGESVVVLTNTMPGFLYGRLNYDQVNFRVWMEAVEAAIKGTKCDKS